MTNAELESLLTLDIATPEQAAKIRARIEYGNNVAAAKSLGCSEIVVRRAVKNVSERAARLGHAPGHFVSGVAPGYALGKVTVQRNAGGDVERTWERQSPSAMLAEEILREWIEGLCDSAAPAPAIPGPVVSDIDLLAVYPLGDPHFGMLSWAKETGENFDLGIAHQLTTAAIDRLVSSSPAAHTGMLLNLGDLFHADDSTNRTRNSGAQLDVDGRFPRIAVVALDAMVHCINRLREKHARVIVRNNRGNHDPHQAFMLSVALNAHFRNDPRVKIDMSPASFYYYRFGKVLIGSTHGDGAKLDELPSIMADDMPEDWGATRYRAWHCGHFHHDQAKEYRGVTVETHRTLAAKDSWHTHMGYRSGRDMKAIIYHREFGEITRIRCGIQMLEAA